MNSINVLTQLNSTEPLAINNYLDRLVVGKSDYVIVLGAGIDSNGSPSAWGCDMLDVAASLHQEGLSSNIIVSGGLSPGDRSPLTPANAGKEYLTKIRHSVEPEKIITMDHATETIGEIFFIAEKIKAMASQAVAEMPTKFLIVVPHYQAKRVEVISEHLFGLLSKETQGRNYSVAILPIYNPYLDRLTLEDRQNKEADRVRTYPETWGKHRISLHHFGEQLMKFHGAYNGDVERAIAGQKLSPDLKPPPTLAVVDPLTRPVLEKTPRLKLGDGKPSVQPAIS